MQEAGVDEPDIVKSDGTTVFALTGGQLHAVDARSPVPRKLDAVTIPGFGGELLIQGRRALTISNGGAGTVLTEIDIANPAAMRVLRTLNIDGELRQRAPARAHRRASSSPRSRARSTCRSPRRGRSRSRLRRSAKKRKPLRARRAGWVPERDAAQPPQRPQAQARARRLRRRPAHAALHRRGHADGG